MHITHPDGRAVASDTPPTTDTDSGERTTTLGPGGGLGTALGRRGLAARAGAAARRSVGLDEDLLGRFEGDRRWYTTQLALVAGVAAMATISMTTALAMTTAAPALGWPVLFGLALGGFVGVCDLSIVLPDGQHHRPRAATYLGRVTFSVLMGALAAMPLTAAIFQRDVDHHEQQARQVTADEAAAAHQRRVDDTRAGVHAAHAPAVAAATAARDDAQRDAEAARTAADAQRGECNAEINGTGSGLAGEGPRASAKCAAAAELAQRVTDTRQHAAVAEVALADAVHAEMADADARTAAIPAPAVAPYQSTELGVIDRIGRTHELLGTIWTLAVTGALMALDTLPVILKLAHGPTSYERILARRHHATATHLLAESLPPPPVTERAAIALLDDDTTNDTGHPLTGDDDLERFVRARLIIDPTLPAKDLWTFARARGYPREYPTFTRFLRTRGLRPPGPRGGDRDVT